jgi:hypothetical protein
MHRNRETISNVKVKWLVFPFLIQEVPERGGTSSMHGVMWNAYPSIRKPE